jgi:CCR4-NOT transcription complex subunit 1
VSFGPYIIYLQREGILKGEDVSSAFYRTAINCAVDHDVKSGGHDGVDSLAKLILLIVKNHGEKTGESRGNRVPNTVYYYNKILTIMSYSLVQRHLEETFDQRPWTRFYSSMLAELATIEVNYKETYIGCLRSFANVLGITQPTYAPRFAFGWLSIISHRLFMPKLLQGDGSVGYADYHRCLMWLLRFLSPFLSGEMSASSRSIYKGTLRVLIVLLHDFPEFLVEFYHTLSTAIPPHCVQLRNVVLSAFPRDEPLLDYYKGLSHFVPDMQRIPTVRSDYISVLASGNIKLAIDEHVLTRMPPAHNIVGELKNRIAVKSMGQDGPRVTYNHTLLHATVFYLGTTAIARHANEHGRAEFDPSAPEVALLTELAFALDPEGEPCSVQD